MTAIETRIGGVWWAKQSAKGTLATVADKKARLVAGDITVGRDDGNEPYADGERYPSAADFVNQINGNGNPGIQGQAGVVGNLAYLMAGQETVTAKGDGSTAPFEHVAAPASTGSFWTTWWKKVGASVGPLRQKFGDCRLVSLRIEGSTAAKVLRVTPTFVSLQPGIIYDTDPVKVEDTGEPMVWTEASGTMTLDGVQIDCHSSFAITIQDTVTPWYGDSASACDVVYGAGTITLENVTILVDANGLAHYYGVIYGDTTPAADLAPTQVIPAAGSYSINFTRGTNPGTAAGALEQVKIEVPGVKWTTDLAIPINVEGGAAEFALGAEARKHLTDPMYRITTRSPDAAYT